MDIQRLIKLVLMELSSDNLKLDDELEKTINSNLEINTKISKIKSILSSMVALDASIHKFTSMMTNNPINKENNDNNM